MLICFFKYKAPSAQPKKTVAIQSTTSRPLVNGVKRPLNQPAGTKSKILPPKIGNKVPTKSPGTKSKQAPTKTTSRPSTARPSVTTDSASSGDSGDEEELAVTARPISNVPARKGK